MAVTEYQNEINMQVSHYYSQRPCDHESLFKINRSSTAKNE